MQDDGNGDGGDDGTDGGDDKPPVRVHVRVHAHGMPCPANMQTQPTQPKDPSSRSASYHLASPVACFVRICMRRVPVGAETQVSP